MSRWPHMMAMVGALWVHAVAFAEPAPEAQREIAYLLGYLEHSGCQFSRSGEWYDAPAARAHIETKYKYLAQRDMVRTTDDFIERAATSSSMGGGVYTVRCADGAVHPSGAWLRRELARFRKAGTAPAMTPAR